MKEKLLVLFLVLFVVCGKLYSQNTISGKTTTKEREPLVGTHLHIGKKTVASDKAGNYIVSQLPIGKTKIHVSYIGYEAIDTIVDLKGDLQLDFIVKESTASLEEVMIKHHENNVVQSVLNQKIKQKTIEKYSNLSLGDALQEVVGVSSLKTGSTLVKPVINGLYGSRVPILNNNVRMEDQDWGIEHAPNFDINSARSISVIKGASGLQYGGDAIGGMVIIEPFHSKKDSIFGKTLFNYDSNGRGGSISSSVYKGNDKGFSWNAIGTYKYLGDRESPNYVLSNTANREKNFTGNIFYNKNRIESGVFYSYYNTTIGILKASHIGNVNDLAQSINSQVPSVVNDFSYTINHPKQEVQHHLSKFHFNYAINEATTLSLQYAFQFNARKEFDVRKGDFKLTPALDLKLETHSAQIDLKKILHDWSLKTGLSTVIQNNKANALTGVRSLIPDYDKSNFGVYGIISRRFSDDFSVDTGLRFDYTKIEATKFYLKSRWIERGYDSTFGEFIIADYGTQLLAKPKFSFQNLSASVGFLKEFKGEIQWYANLGLVSRNPNPSEYFSDGLHHSTGVIELGELGLQKEQALKLSTSLIKKWKKVEVEVNPYCNAIYNYMFLEPKAFETTIRGVFPVWNYKQTDARILGLDAKSTWNIHNQWQQIFSFSYLNGQDLTRKDALINMPPLTFKNKIEFSKKEWSNLTMSIDNELVLHQDRFPNNDFTTNIVQNGELIPVLVKISTPPPTYHLMHFYASTKLKTFKRVATTLSLSIQNILNTNYRDYLNRQRLFADEPGRNIKIQLILNY